MALASFSTVAFAGSAAVSFDGVSSNAGFSVQELKERSKADAGIRTPVPSSAPVSNELTSFWANLETDGMDKLCRVAQININQNARLVKVAGLGGGIRRLLKPLMNKRLVLIDEINVKLGLSYNHEVFRLPGSGPLSIGVSGGIEGRSVVVRPLESTSYCENLPSLVKLYDVKTVLPITAKRILDMEIGEIWKLPVVARYSISGSVGLPVGQFITISIGGGFAEESKPSFSLYKIAGNDIRLRLRIEQVTVRSAGISAQTIAIPAGAIGLLSGEDFLTTLVDRTAAAQINRFLAFKLGYDYVRTSGQKLLLEFHIDPNDAAQSAKLVEFLEGDFDSISKFIALGLKFDTFNEDADGRDGLGDIEALAGSAAAVVAAPAAFAGSDHYNGSSGNFSVNVPIIYSRRDSWSTTYHRYQTLTNGGSAVHVRQNARASNSDMFNIPFFGTQQRHNSDKNISVVNKEQIDGRVAKPVLLYQQYEGLIGKGANSARAMLRNANNVLQYAGMRGNGVTYANGLPVAAIFPLLPPADAAGAGDDGDYDRTYKAVIMSFKLGLSETAVQDIVFAAPELILKSYLNVMLETKSTLVNKVKDLFTVDEKGEVSNDREAAEKRLDPGILAACTNPLRVVETLADAAAEFIKKILAVREETAWKTRSERLAAAGTSGEMEYEDFLKVVIQLVNPKDITSEIYLHTDKRVEGETDVTQNYTIFNNRENGAGSTLDEVAALRDRFAEPTDLTD